MRRGVGVHGVRVVLIGGTSNVGKSTVGRAVAERLGFAYRSTDLLARHPGRPWRTPEREVPGHVAEHYASLTVDELITSVLAHYERLWPRIRTLIATHAAQDEAGAGLVLEGSALWPVRVAGLDVPHTAAVWLTADEAVLRARVRTGGRYEAATAEERALMDSFLARTERYQSLMVEALDELGLGCIDAGAGRTVAALVESVLDAVAEQGAADGS
ncbi:AAA family ATPase [Streptomyces guryensis]|uniref:AAA family ATPase n=1 Tax=Streptomyces guryensis TaxID=2886947 RepID=A0A9Q3Z7K0_9ACTN|nr:AAA family ATPase [Streptomyces guryensis]MCD9874632.1 AAA family ATPase [Streptomyces guryensis]